MYDCLTAATSLLPLQVIAEALLAVLPGLDANDESKTLATVYFITSVLASGAVLGEGEEVEGASPGGMCGLRGMTRWMAEC
jgi:hypothetical protein